MISTATKMLSSLSLLLSANLIGHGLAVSYNARQIFQFPSKPFTSIENVALRPNGDLILTTTSAPTIYLLDPTQATPSAKLLYTFPDATSCLGITETSSDVFAVVVGNVSLTTFGGVPGSFSIWSVNLGQSSTPIVKKIAAIPQAKILNGLTHLPDNTDIVLAADSEAGIVYSLNIVSGVSAVAIQNSAFSPGAKGLGINGLHVDAANSNLYFTNSALGTFSHISINGNNGEATGAATVIATAAEGENYDDFAIDSQGNFWITLHPDIVTEVTEAGVQTIILNSTTILQPTSAIFSAGGQTLYIVTDGDAEAHTQSGQVYEVSI
jgi:SMP-30/Gluconolactonase/LRE-like region